MWKILFFKNHAENETGRLVPDHLFSKSFIWGKSKWAAPLVLMYFNNPQLRDTIKQIA